MKRMNQMASHLGGVSSRASLGGNVCRSEQISSFDSFMMLLTEEVRRTRFLRGVRQRHGNHLDCSSRCVFARRRGLGIHSLS